MVLSMTVTPHHSPYSIQLHLTSKTILFHAILLRERQEDQIFCALLKLCHGLEDRLADAELEEVQLIGDLASVLHVISSIDLHLSDTAQIQKGINASRADDTKGMKGAIIEWFTPAD